MMRFNSLAFRLAALAAAWSLFVLPVTAIVLRYVYQDSVKKNLRLSMDSDLIELAQALALAGKDDKGNLKFKTLNRPEYNEPLSGVYWQVQNLTPTTETKILHHSDSLQAEQLIHLPGEIEQQIEERRLALGAYDVNSVYDPIVNGPRKQKLYSVVQIFDVNDGDLSKSYLLMVTRNWLEVEEEMQEFTTKLSWALFILGIGLVIPPFVQVHFGLRPLRAISTDLADIRSGKADQLKGELPAEIRPLQKELNALLTANREVIERARTHVGNLAHALKTPLSVISNEASDSDTQLANKVIEQSRVMRDQITHYLDRARMAARVNVIGSVTEIGPVLDALVRVLERVHTERGVVIEKEYDGSLQFQGEQQDLEEMVGNLMDNACKWANGTVKVTVKHIPAGNKDEQDMLEVAIDDNGKGLSEEEMARAVKRGQRLDESKPGSGLGLSIVADSAHLYNGSFRLKQSPLGGLQAVLLLPSAHEADEI